MERNIQRINGIKIDIGHVTDDELEGMMAHTWGRIEAGHADLEKLGIESARRFATDGLARVIELRPRDPNQPTLFDPDSAA